MSKSKLLLLSCVLMSACHAQSESPTMGERMGAALEKAAKATGAIKDHGEVRKVKPGAAPKIVLKDGKIFYNDQPLVLGQDFARWRKVIGEKSAVCGGQGGKTSWCKWDEAGIEIGNGADGSGKVRHLSLLFQPQLKERAEYAPPDQPAPQWMTAGVFPGYLELDGFGIDKETRFWEIKQSVSRQRELRCGLKDCSHPMGSFSEQANLYLTLAGRDERSALKKFNISESPAP